MRKAGLIDGKPLTATRAMLERAKSDRGVEKRAETPFHTHSYTEYETRFYFRAVSSRGILEVDLFTRKDLAAGRKEPRFRIFLDREKKDFESWNTVEKKWSRAKIDMLETGDNRYRYSYRGRNHATAETLRTVNRYLGTGCQKDVETAVFDFQAGIRKCVLQEKHRLITDAIDGYMDMVPDRLPADWEKFLNDRVQEHSIFYRKQEGTGYCTRCREHVCIPEGTRHGMQGKCTRCGAAATYRSWGKQKNTECRSRAALLQKCTDGVHFVYRQFHACFRTCQVRGYVPEVHVWEEYRNIFRIEGAGSIARSMAGYEWGTFRNTGIRRWCHEGTVNHGGYYHGGMGKKSILYTGNLTRLLKDTTFRYVAVAEMIKGTGNKRIDVMEVLNDMQYRFPYEAFWKMGMREFCLERIRRNGERGLARIELHEGAKPWECLKMTREGMKQAVRLNATDRQVRIIQKAAGTGTVLTDEQVAWIDGHLGAHELLEYLGIQTAHRIIRYLNENLTTGDGLDNTMLYLWTDYLDMARQMGWDLQDRSVFFPQDAGRAHDEAAAAFTIWKDTEDAEKMKARDKIMRRNAERIRRIFRYSDGTYTIRVPECFLDFKHEGNAQHNCVATYYDRAVEGRCIILSIRKRQDPDRPFCTVEIRDTGGKLAIIQNRTAYNRDAPADAVAFMEQATRKAQKEIDRMAAAEAQQEAGRTAGESAGRNRRRAAV